ncbi:hypothetical protein F5887DRAFT_1203945 [Amanita rubescens]|nr:hypothetical protein F5887DRAFT_1203945 [Amanita rubescens]
MLFLYALLCVTISGTSAAASTSLFDTTSSLFIPSSRSQRRSFPVIAIRSGDSASGGYRRPTLSTAGLDDAASDPGHASRPSSPGTEIASTKSSPVHPKPEWKPTSPEPKGQPETGGPYNKKAGFDDTASVDRFPIHRGRTSIPSTGPPPPRTLSLNRGTLPEIKPPPPPKDSKSRKSVVPFFQQKTNERKAQQQSQKQDLKPSQPEIGVQPPQHGGTFFHKLAAKAAERNKPKPPPQPETGGHPPGAPQRGANIFQKLAAAGSRTQQASRSCDC